VVIVDGSSVDASQSLCGGQPWFRL